MGSEDGKSDDDEGFESEEGSGDEADDFAKK
jgi:hypothetical protein